MRKRNTSHLKAVSRVLGNSRSNIWKREREREANLMYTYCTVYYTVYVILYYSPMDSLFDSYVYRSNEISFRREVYVPMYYSRPIIFNFEMECIAFLAKRF